MKSCAGCGTGITTNFTFCRACWAARNNERNGAGAPSVVSAPNGTPLDVDCDYVTSYGPEEGVACGAGVGQPCTFGWYAPSLGSRMVGLGAAGRVEVHETRFQKWRAQPVQIS